jgi:hypothetical protein
MPLGQRLLTVPVTQMLVPTYVMWSKQHIESPGLSLSKNTLPLLAATL